jgi:serine phosphatase RsbU (regulator of sigma subunit)
VSKKKKSEDNEIETTLKLYRHLEKTLQERTQELKEKNREREDSIQYAKFIQDSLLPKESHLGQHFSEHFVIHRQRDTVGGDTYWLHVAYDCIIIALIDCTGHGIPGAFMTMIVNSILNRALEEQSSTYIADNPAAILKKVNYLLRTAMHKDFGSSLADDGADMGILSYNPQKKTATFSGANINLLTSSNDKINIIKGDKQSVGYKKSRLDYDYQNKEISVSEDTSLYLSTDGYFTQCGGPKGLPLGHKRFIRYLESGLSLPFEEQQEQLNSLLFAYQGIESQRDDITVLGFKC